NNLQEPKVFDVDTQRSKTTDLHLMIKILKENTLQILPSLEGGVARLSFYTHQSVQAGGHNSDYAIFIVWWWLHENAEESDLRSRLMAYSLVRRRKSSEGCAGLTEALLFSFHRGRLRIICVLEALVTKPLETVITKPAKVKVITDGFEDAEGMMKKYKSSRSSKVLEAVVKFLVVGIRDVVLETISIYCLDPEDLEALL
nr:hypothetical protein [Tanacetum cinerariifolium]